MASRTRSSIAAAVLVLLLAGCEQERTAAPPTPPASVAAPNGVDFLFAEMMAGHHAQAVRMSRTLIAKPDVPDRARAIAEYIAHDQQREIDEMNAWLSAWDRPAASPSSHSGPDAAAHGMLTEAQLAQSASAAPPEATRLYLEQMIQHHAGAITMARSALESGRNVYIRNLAKHIVNEQSAENDAMRTLLADLA